MGKEEAIDALAAAVRSAGLGGPAESVVVLISGGADSACAAAALADVLGAESVHALHLNYGLRETADRDEKTCRQLCARLRIDLHIERVELGEGNLQAEAR